MSFLNFYFKILTCVRGGFEDIQYLAHLIVTCHIIVVLKIIFNILI